MGKSHALSGAVGWLAGSAVLTTCGVDLEPATVWMGAAVSAGLALLPDLDHPGSTVSRTLGPITRGLSAAVVWVARQSQQVSCTHCGRDPESGGHRGLTHTAAGALTTGLAVTAGVLLAGRGFALAVIGFAVWLLAHTALSSKVRAQLGDLILPGKFRRLNRTAFRFTAAVGAALVGLLAVALVADQQIGWWLGLAVGWGCLAHSLGDALTYSRVPLLWPARIRGCRWARVGAPRWLRFRTGSRTETVVVALMAAIGFAAASMLGGVR